MVWFLTAAEQSLALMLVDSGYDVWIGNSRGTRFGRRHVSLDPNGPVYLLLFNMNLLSPGHSSINVILSTYNVFG